jgi:hypothetical protein
VYQALTTLSFCATFLPTQNLPYGTINLNSPASFSLIFPLILTPKVRPFPDFYFCVEQARRYHISTLCRECISIYWRTNWTAVKTVSFLLNLSNLKCDLLILDSQVKRTQLNNEVPLTCAQFTGFYAEAIGRR